jgi:hypothetical protein
VRNVARWARLALPRTPRRYPAHIERTSSYPALYRPGWLAGELTARRPLSSIADEVGCSTSAVRRAIAKLGITDRRMHGEIRFPELHDRAWLRDQYVHRRRSAATIAAGLGASEVAVVRALKAARSKRRRPLTRQKPRPPAERLRADWRLFGNVRAVARLNGVGPALAEAWLAEAGIITRTEPAIPPDVLEAEVESGRSLRSIAQQLGVDHRVVRTEMCRLAAEVVEEIERA